MSVIVIQDFSGMMPLRDGLLLPDRNAQYAKNTWLYKGSIRGFRHAIPAHTTIYSDTKQVYRIPESLAEPPDFSASTWLEYPDEFMATIRNPVVGDQWNRYYFFPSDHYSSTGANPDWPTTKPPPRYRTYDPVAHTVGPLLILGIPTPVTAPTVVAAPGSVTKVATANSAAGSTTLTITDTTNLSEGMAVTDTTDHTVTHNTTANTSADTTTVTYQTVATTNPGATPSSVTHTVASTVPLNGNVMNMTSVTGIVVGMLVSDLTHPEKIAGGTIVTGIAGTNVTLSQGTLTSNNIFPTENIQFQIIGPNMLVVNSTANIANGMPVTDLSNSSVIAAGTTVASVSGLTVTLSANVASIVNAGDNIQFGNTGSNVLQMNSVSGILVGMTITDNTNSNALIYGTTVTGISGLSITMSQAVASSGVASGDSIKFQNNPFPTAASIDTGGVGTTTVTLTAAVGGAGVLSGDTIAFDVNQTEARSYVYTYVSAYGEEGPASPPATDIGNPTGTWNITIPPPDPTAATGRNLAKVRLYRTVTDASGNATYYQVTDFPWTTGTITYPDNNSITTVVNGSPLTSELYTPPPEDLQGVVMMANGILAGWSNQREVWFSAAYLPHAWPPSYALTVDYPIVGLTANGASLNIMCKGTPFIATGVTPDTITVGRISSNEPCISRGSIVSSGEGAYYASPNGVILLNSSGTTVMTEFVYEKEFHNTLQPWNWASGHYGQSYVFFVKGAGLTGVDPDGQTLHGGILDKEDKNVPFCYLHFNRTIRNMYFDEISGQLFGLLDDGEVLQWNPPIGNPGTTILWDWTWKSKNFRMAFPASIKAFQVIFDIPDEVNITLGPRNTSQTQVFNPATQLLIVKVYADDRLVVIREVQRSEEILLIPDSFKARFWEIELVGQVNVVFFRMSTSIKELRKT